MISVHSFCQNISVKTCLTKDRLDLLQLIWSDEGQFGVYCTFGLVRYIPAKACFTEEQLDSLVDDVNLSGLLFYQFAFLETAIVSVSGRRLFRL
jgi:hypothetical protein